MIAHDFVYAQPDTKEAAAALYTEFQNQALQPCYYGGGSEIITMCRSGSIRPGAVIDLKKIPEANQLQVQGDALIMGGCIPLRAIGDSKLFPLLGTVSGRIADHTNQCRITLGGNLCSTILYRETAQPLMLCGAELILFGPQGERTVPMREGFRHRMELGAGDMVLQVKVPQRYLGLRYCHVKKTANERIDYPLLSVSSIRHKGKMRFAFSGLLPYPFRSEEMEGALNQKDVPAMGRIEQALACLPQQPMTDYQGSGAYRLFVLQRTLAEMLEVWES